MKRLRTLVVAFVWILPASPTKNRLLRRLGHSVHPSAVARSNIVLKVTRITMGPGSRIGNGT